MRLLSSYKLTRTVANANVDGKDGLNVLSDADEFVRCSRARFKERKKEMDAEEEYMKKALEMQMVVALTEEDEQRNIQKRASRLDQNVERDVGNPINDRIVYHITCCLLRRRKAGCADCFSTMVGSKCTSADAGVQQLSQAKDHGSLIYCSANVYDLLCMVEESFLKAVQDGSVFSKEGFEDILHDVCLDNLPLVGCSEHMMKCMADLIYDYLVFRYFI